MSDEENNNGNENTQDTTPETPADRPVFNPEMIIENSQEPIDNFPSDNISDYIEKSEE
jgi:hypothetical protein